MLNIKVSKLVIALMLGTVIAASGMVSPIVLAEQTNTQQNEQVQPPVDSNNQSNEHSDHH